jgi:hypothetical protein
LLYDSRSSSWAYNEKTKRNDCISN